MKTRFGILSHILPPSGSGQAIILSRLFSNIDSKEYFVISSRLTSDSDTRPVCAPLAAKTYSLAIPHKVPIVSHFKLELVIQILNFGIQTICKYLKLSKILKQERCNTLIACSGDLFDIPAAYLASRRYNVSFIPYLFDDYYYQWTGINRLIAGKILDHIFLKCKTAIVPNEALQKEYIARYDLIPTVIHNPCDFTAINKAVPQTSHFDKSTYNIVYTGSIYHAHYDAFKNLLVAIDHLNDITVRLHLFTEQSPEELSANGLDSDHIINHPHVSQTEIYSILKCADILFLPLAFNSPIHEVIKTSAPGKTGEYLAAGRPILVHAPPDSFISCFFKENCCGVVVDRTDSKFLAESIQRIRNNPEENINMTSRANNIAKSDFCIEKMQSKFLEFISQHAKATK